MENIQHLEPEKSKRYLNIINSSAKTSLTLLDNLLHWAKSQTGQITFAPEKIVLSSVIKEIFELSSSSAKRKYISLNHIQTEEIVIFADVDMIKTVLRNLISNAIKFTRLHGKIDVTASKKSDSIELEVADNGVGMREEIRNKLFDFRTNKSTTGTANESGSGLGLMLCNEFIEKHGGKIGVESELGKGSIFKIQLPLQA